MSLAVRGIAETVGAFAFHDLAVWGRALGWFTSSVLRVRRAHVEHAMARAGIDSPERHAREMYASLGSSALELLWLCARRRNLAQCTQMDAISSQEIECARSRGRGIIFAASHTGNWDLVACAMAQRLTLMVVTKRLSMTSLDSFWQSSRANYGIELVFAEGAIAHVKRHLRQNGAVAMMIDQVPLHARHAIQTSFLGETVYVDRAPFAVAMETQASVLVSAARRTPYGQEVSILKSIEPPKHPNLAWIALAAKESTATLEAFVRAYPSEWLWMHRRWKEPPSSSAVDAKRIRELTSAP